MHDIEIESQPGDLKARNGKRDCTWEVSATVSPTNAGRSLHPLALKVTEKDNDHSVLPQCHLATAT